MKRVEQVLELVDQGVTSNRIAELLGISPHTVRYYREAARYGTHSSKVGEHRLRIKRKAIDYSGGCCLKCNYNSCFAALIFHHVDPTRKEHEIGSGWSLSWIRTKVELDKTILLCNRCHTELHAGFWALTDEMILSQANIRIAYSDRPLLEYRTIC